MIDSLRLKVNQISSLNVSAFSFTLGIMLLSFGSVPSLAAEPPISACFTPPRGCTKLIIQRIEKATTSIDLQAYSFTSQPITDALCRAIDRGVKVRAIFDKSQLHDRHSRWKQLQEHGAEVKIDTVPGIAHNKVMIIDATWVISGSFNFTQAAETRNAENVLFINNPDTTASFIDNWQKRWIAAYNPKYEFKRNGESVTKILDQTLTWVGDNLI
jgi:phospholipase D